MKVCFVSVSGEINLNEQIFSSTAANSDSLATTQKRKASKRPDSSKGIVYLFHTYGNRIEMHNKLHY